MKFSLFLFILNISISTYVKPEETIIELEKEIID